MPNINEAHGTNLKDGLKLYEGNQDGIPWFPDIAKLIRAVNTLASPSETEDMKTRLDAIESKITSIESKINAIENKLDM